MTDSKELLAQRSRHACTVMKGQIAFASRVSWTKLPNRWRKKIYLSVKYEGLAPKKYSLFSQKR